MEDNRAVHQSLWSPLLVPLFRALWMASLVANIGVWMQNVSGVWLMTTLSPSPLLIALMQTATSFPVVLLGLPSGALADIVDRRQLLMIGLAIMLTGVLIRWRSSRQSSALPSERVIGALRAGLRYLRHAPPLQAVLVRLAVFISCGSALWALLPLVAQRDLNLGGLGYGIFLGCLGLGA